RPSPAGRRGPAAEQRAARQDLPDPGGARAAFFGVRGRHRPCDEGRLMRQINLIPPEIAHRRRAREITLLIGAAGLALVAVLVLVFLVETARLAGERHKLDKAKAQNQALQIRVGQLENVATDQQTLQNKQRLLATLTQNEVRW